MATLPNEPAFGSEFSSSPAAPQPLAVASLIVSGAGLCVPFLGLVGVALAVGGLMSASRRGLGSGLSIGGIVLGIVTTALWLLAALVIWPALKSGFDSGFDTGRAAMAGGYAAIIVTNLDAHAAANGGVYPAPGTDLEALLGTSVPETVWRTPLEARAEGRPTLLLVYESTDPPYRPRWIIANPDIPGDTSLPMVDVATGDMQFKRAVEIVGLIGDSALFTTDGRPWRLTGPVP